MLRHLMIISIYILYALKLCQSLIHSTRSSFETSNMKPSEDNSLAIITGVHSVHTCMKECAVKHDQTCLALVWNQQSTLCELFGSLSPEVSISGTEHAFVATGRHGYLGKHMIDVLLKYGNCPF